MSSISETSTFGRGTGFLQQRQCCPAHLVLEMSTGDVKPGHFEVFLKREGVPCCAILLAPGQSFSGGHLPCHGSVALRNLPEIWSGWRLARNLQGAFLAKACQVHGFARARTVALRCTKHESCLKT
mmetsp:Transcript_15404/g.36326  ORF Transcript_15404/g.36326 Transcript_15404/m.36326 type:complete len:126 (+) Transcript_15404:1671-2048(+)